MTWENASHIYTTPPKWLIKLSLVFIVVFYIFKIYLVNTRVALNTLDSIIRGITISFTEFPNILVRDHIGL